MELDPIQPQHTELILPLPMCPAPITVPFPNPLLPRQVFPRSHSMQPPPQGAPVSCSREIACVGRARARGSVYPDGETCDGLGAMGLPAGAKGTVSRGESNGVSAGNRHGEERGEPASQLGMHSSLPAWAGTINLSAASSARFWALNPWLFPLHPIAQLTVQSTTHVLLSGAVFPAPAPCQGKVAISAPEAAAFPAPFSITVG